MATKAFARAKINLALHVTGRRADGYHLLDSLVAFADVGDNITAEPATSLSLHLTGPKSAGLSDTDNLVLRAACALHPSLGARLTLDKHLPVASGIGGGSADAAATLHALSELWSLPLPNPETLLALGADVPVCLLGHSARMQGIGEEITPVTLPRASIVLANPGVAVPTPQVFAALQSRSNRALDPLPPLPDVAALAAYLQTQRNDLQSAACTIAAAIDTTLTALQSQPDCLIARMSGSGATCFALFATAAAATNAATRLQSSHPKWWIAAAALT
jgi:4-diphosphocytidyl-2-C-methyl-D-erythritol kinase